MNPLSIVIILQVAFFITVGAICGAVLGLVFSIPFFPIAPDLFIAGGAVIGGLIGFRESYMGR